MGVQEDRRTCATFKAQFFSPGKEKNGKMPKFQLKQSGSRHGGCYASVLAESTARSSHMLVCEAAVGSKALVIIQDLSSAAFQLNRN
jgi:hypothetical protein